MRFLARPGIPRYENTALGSRQHPVVASEGFEPPKSMTADLQSDPFGRLGNSPGAHPPGLCSRPKARRPILLDVSATKKPRRSSTHYRQDAMSGTDPVYAVFG